MADIVVTDDALGTNTLALGGADAALFEIDGSELFLSAGASLDFETMPALDVTVSVDDATLDPSPNDTAALSLGITDVNEPPMAVDDNYNIVQFAAQVGLNPTGNDTDPDGDTLTVTELFPVDEAMAFAPASGLGMQTASGGIVLIEEDGTLAYAAALGFMGSEVVEYEITDAGGETDIGRITFTVTENSLTEAEMQARSVAYLYEAAFDRFPDLPGLNFWIDAVFNELPGQTVALDILDVAQFFLDSPEFETLVGDPEENLSDEAFIGQLYRNILDREGDQAGIDFWVQSLADSNFDRADLLTAFALSPENQIGAVAITALVETVPGNWDFV